VSRKIALHKQLSKISRDSDTFCPKCRVYGKLDSKRIERPGVARQKNLFKKTEYGIIYAMSHIDCLFLVPDQRMNSATSLLTHLTIPDIFSLLFLYALHFTTYLYVVGFKKM